MRGFEGVRFLFWPKPKQDGQEGGNDRNWECQWMKDEPDQRAAGHERHDRRLDRVACHVIPVIGNCIVCRRNQYFAPIETESGDDRLIRCVFPERITASDGWRI